MEAIQHAHTQKSHGQRERYHGPRAATAPRAPMVACNGSSTGRQAAQWDIVNQDIVAPVIIAAKTKSAYSELSTFTFYVSPLE